jgi:hypothetical protein
VLRLHPQRNGDCHAVAQRNFIRNAAATPNSMILFESCGAAGLLGWCTAPERDADRLGLAERQHPRRSDFPDRIAIVARDLIW